MADAPPKIRAGDRVQIAGGSKGLVLQQYDRLSRFCLVRWNGDIYEDFRDAVVEKSRLKVE